MKLTGRVIQVLESDNEVDLRVATNETGYGYGFDDIVLVFVRPDVLPSRILEDDVITIYGVSMGLHTYTSLLDMEITLPLIQADKVEFVSMS